MKRIGLTRLRVTLDAHQLHRGIRREEWIDFREAEKIDEASFKQLIRAAVAANSAALAQRAARKK
jgi:hypothetical protein